MLPQPTTIIRLCCHYLYSPSITTWYWAGYVIIQIESYLIILISVNLIKYI